MNAIKSPIETPNGNIAEQTGKVKRCTVLRQPPVIKDVKELLRLGSGPCQLEI